MALAGAYQPVKPQLLDGREKSVKKLDPKDQAAIERARKQMRRDAAIRNEAIEFWRGNQYVYRDRENYLVKQGTLQNESGKPGHRIRKPRNLILDIVAREVSAATQRVPRPDVQPSSTDPDRVDAARLSEKICMYGQDAWNVREATVSTAWYAIVADEGFAWPYFDATVGEPITDEVSTGQIKIRVMGANQVGWEPGVKFEDSRYHIVEQAEPVDQVKAYPGYHGPDELVADADSSDSASTKAQTRGEKLCLVTRFLERPSQKNPQGRMLTVANKQQICPAEPYPCIDSDGEVMDEPVLHKLSYFTDPDDDRDKGLVRHLVDPQRAFNLASNKQLEWMVMALNPQLFIVNGALKQPLNDEPGAQYNVMGATGPNGVQWRPVPPIPPELATIRNEASADMGRISAQNDIPSQIEAGKAIATFVERDQERRQEFIANLAKWYSRLFRHCLYLVQRHYTEERTIQLTGEFGPELIESFKGAQLKSQADVRVTAASIEPTTREAIEQKIFAYADRQWITSQEAMLAINAGTAEQFVEDVERDQAYARWCINRFKQLEGMEVVDPSQLPMVRPGIDNHQVQMDVLKSYAKTMDFLSLETGTQGFIINFIEMHQQALMDEQAKQAAAQAEQAAQLGMGNAARPQGDTPPLPSQPSAKPPPAPGQPQHGGDNG